MPDILKPDAKALVWLAIGYFVLGGLISAVLGMFGKGQ